jgi:cytochrome P450
VPPMTTLDVDLTARSLYRQGFPHELFTELRARAAVLHHASTVLERAPHGMEFWVVVRHAEVLEASRDWQRFSALDGPAISPVPGMQQSEALVFADPPTHTRLRKLIAAGFTPRMIARLDDQVRIRVGQILDAVAERDGNVDFVRDIAYELPMQLIGDIVGIPDADRRHVFGLTDTFMRAGDPHSGLTIAERELAQIELYQYATALGAEKRAHPTDDVWSMLAAAELEGPDGERIRLSDFQLDVFFLILSVAGSETTRNAISQGLLALVERPDDLADLRADPMLWDTATDEVIRWASPVTDFGRTATADTELGGVQIAAGDRVMLFYPSANRDERAFTDPFRFDIRRSPNHHVSFGGGGVHYCLGAHLARREIRTLLEQILARFDHVEITGDITGPPRAPTSRSPPRSIACRCASRRRAAGSPSADATTSRTHVGP